MTEDRSNLFTALEPPPGGLPALRARLARDRRPRLVPALLAVAAAGAIVLLAWRLRPPRSTLGDDLARRDYPAMVALGLRAPPEEPVTSLPSGRAPRALRRIPVASPTVVVYVAERAPVRD
jgi:hypothetical protein